MADRDFNSDLGWLLTAHIAMLRDQSLIDDAAASILAGVIKRVEQAEFDWTNPFRALLQFDERVSSQSPPGFAGAAQIGRGSNEVVAALIRFRLRSDLLALAALVTDLRLRLITLADQHVVTLMPAYQDGQPAQPTTFAHFLGGVLGPLARAFKRLLLAYEQVNQSPLGAGALASTGLPIDRERLAELAGFEGVVTNTFDAVSAVDHFVATTQTINAILRPLVRLLDEIRTLHRTDPSALLLDQTVTERMTDLPQLRSVNQFDLLDRQSRTIETGFATIGQWANSAVLGPTIDLVHPLQWMADCFAETGRFLTGFATFFTEDIALNRAYLANRANRGHSTIGELTDFLMLEEQIQPSQAREITARVLAQILDSGVESSGVSVEMIDAAAIVVLGREIGAEFETISKYLAPRRFIERRTATGAPSPTATRAWLADEREQCERDRQWAAEKRELLVRARIELDRLTGDESS